MAWHGAPHLVASTETSLRRLHRVAAIPISAFLRRTDLLGSDGLHDEMDPPDLYYFECFYSLIPPAFRFG